MKQKKPSKWTLFSTLKLTPPPFVKALVLRFYDFLDWIAPAVEWVEGQAEKYKAASDAVPPPSKRWVQKRQLNSRNMTVTVYMLFLTVMTVMALYLPIRPTYSDLEQRNLTTFPKPTFFSVLDGSFFDGVNTWFSDTFPMRESFLSFHSSMKAYYGFGGRNVIGDVDIGDDIPDAPKQEPTDTAQEQGADTSSSQVSDSSQSAEASTAPAEEPTSDVKQDLTQWDESTSTAEEATDTPADSDTQQSSTSETTETTETEQTQETPADSTVEEAQPEESKAEGKADTEVKTENDDATAQDVETLGALLTIKNSAYEYYNFIKSTADSYIDLLNHAAKLLDGKAKVYNVIVPTSMDICVPERIRKKLNTSNQSDAINYMYSSMSSKVNTVSILDTLKEQESNGEYLYFRTDHHWTAKGAFYAYQQYASTAGKTPAPLSDFTEHVYEGFLGSFYRQTESKKMASKPDTIYAYEPSSPQKIEVHDAEGNTINYNVIRNADKMSASTKYLCFIAGDNPLSVMENENIHDGSAVMLIKESFGNCFAPYLTANYQYVYVVDYRYIKKIDNRSLSQMVSDYGINDVIFLNNISVTREKTLISKISSFVG